MSVIKLNTNRMSELNHIHCIYFDKRYETRVQPAVLFSVSTLSAVDVRQSGSVLSNKVLIFAIHILQHQNQSGV